MPISAEEITATAQAGGGELNAPLDAVSQVSAGRPATSLFAEAGRIGGTITPTALATQSAATTATLTPTNAVTPSVTNTTTPSVTPSPPSSGTPQPSGTPSATVTGTVTLTVTPSPPGTPSATETPNPAPALAIGGAGMQAGAIAAVNQVRTNSGRNALTVSGTLTEAANRYAQSMAEQGFFGHDGKDGSSPQSRIVAAGYGGSFRGEALAAGQSSPQGAVATWLNSPSHAAILLEPSSVEVGIGYYYAPESTYGYYWVLVTGVP